MALALYVRLLIHKKSNGRVPLSALPMPTWLQTDDKWIIDDWLESQVVKGKDTCRKQRSLALKSTAWISALVFVTAMAAFGVARSMRAESKRLAPR